MEFEGINKFARVMQSRMGEVGASPLVLDFGVIQGDRSLKTNTYDIPIPPSDYLVCRSLLVGALGSTLTTATADQGNHGHGPSGEHGGHKEETDTGAHTHPATEGAHTHDIDVPVPASLRSVLPGDRVLVAWVGNDAVVIDIICSGSEV